MLMVDGTLQVAAANELHSIDIATGESKSVIETGLSDDYDRSLYKTFLAQSGDTLLFCHPADATILLYGPNGQKKIFQIPAPYTLKEFHGRDHSTGKLYFELRPYGKRETYHMFPLLEFDLTAPDREVDYFAGPEMEIELRESEESVTESEVWITATGGASIDEIFVYAEMHAEDQAWYHGHQGTMQHTERITENFNGKVHFRYITDNPSDEELAEKLRLLKSRFDAWAGDNAYSALDNSKAVTLDAQAVRAN